MIKKKRRGKNSLEQRSEGGRKVCNPSSMPDQLVGVYESKEQNPALFVFYPKKIGAIAKAATAPAKSARRQQTTACPVFLIFTLPK